MAVREFVDDAGRQWRAWDILPERVHPATKTEDYLADCYVTGWIVFETLSGNEKRRLCPWPVNWMDRSDHELRALLGMAEVVASPPGSAERMVDSRRTSKPVPMLHEKRDLSELDVARTFRYPGGRFWTVCVMRHPEDGGSPRLRFTSGLRTIDLWRWPKAWADLPDDELVALLRRAAPRNPAPAVPGAPQRRWDDHPRAGR